MSATSYLIDDAGNEPWDVVVIGTGMGGATAGHELARRGRRVLFLEKGPFLFGDTERGPGKVLVNEDDRPEARRARGRWPLPLQGKTSFGEVEFFAPLGTGTGGTSSLYAAQLERFLPSDFEPRQHHPDETDASLPEAGPIRYEELTPYYERAERLYRVSGTPDPLHGCGGESLREPPALSPRDQDLFDSFAQLGLHPYRAHVGYEFVPGCGECGGALCPKRCKSDSGNVALMPALTEHGAKLMVDCEVLALEAGDSRVEQVRFRRGGEERTVRAHVVVLAAGAYMTPLLLLNSTSEQWPDGVANRSGLVGRNLMLHSGDFIAVRPRTNASMVGPKKALALNDFYVSDGKKLGTFQSVGVTVEPGSVMYYLRNQLAMLPRLWLRLLSPLLKIAAYLGAYYFRSAAVLATIVEDLPYADNRIIPDPSAKNGMRFEYRYTDDLRARNGLLRAKLKRALGPNHRVFVLGTDNNINYGHVCGTCRFGDDPATSVLDRDNRAHDVENLYVVDASFFPSSGGTNPSLTIAANAIRVGEVIDGRLGERLEAPQSRESLPVVG